MRQDAIILTESGDGIGFGHLVRMTAAAAALERNGVNCRRVSQHVGAPLPLLKGWEEGAWRSGDPAEWARSSDLVIVDSYRADGEFYRALVETGTRVLAIDDFGRLDYEGCYVLNPNPFGESSDGPWQGEESTRRGGADYVLLREEIVSAAGRFQIRPGIDRVLVTLGGSDPQDRSSRVASIAAETGAEIVVVAGNPSANEESGRSAPLRLAPLDAADFVEAILDADLVVSACGQTLHELACLGVPAIGLCVGDDQLGNQAYYLNCGFLGRQLDGRALGWEHDLAEELAQMTPESVRRSRAASTVIDGRGAERVAQWVKEICEKSSPPNLQLS